MHLNLATEGRQTERKRQTSGGGGGELRARAARYCCCRAVVREQGRRFARIPYSRYVCENSIIVEGEERGFERRKGKVGTSGSEALECSNLPTSSSFFNSFCYLRPVVVALAVPVLVGCLLACLTVWHTKLWTNIKQT